MSVDFFLDLSAKYINIAINIDTKAIEKFERRIDSKKLGINNLIYPQKRISGIDPINIEL